MIAFTRSTILLPHQRFANSLGGPLVRVLAAIEHVFPSPENHHGANHEQLVIGGAVVELAQGLAAGEAVGPRIFVAIRFGDAEGLADPVAFTEGTQVRLQGEYIDAAAAYVTADNPGLPVLHFTHHPAGYVEYPVGTAAAPGPIFS